MDLKGRQHRRSRLTSSVDNRAYAGLDRDRRFATKTSIRFDDAWQSDRASLTHLAENAIKHSVPIDDLEMRAVFHNVSDSLRWATENHDAGVFIQCTIDDRIVGMILIKHFWNLCCLFVDPMFHRSGIGKALVAEAVLRCLKSAQHAQVKVNSSPNAVGFYLAVGFVPDEGRKPPGSSVPMMLDLKRYEPLTTAEPA